MSSRDPFSIQFLSIGATINVLGYLKTNPGSLRPAITIAAAEEVKAKARVGLTSPDHVINGSGVVAMEMTSRNGEVVDGGGGGNRSASEMRGEVVKLF